QRRHLRAGACARAHARVLPAGAGGQPRRAGVPRGGGGAGDDRARLRPDRQHQLDPRPLRRGAGARLRRRQGRARPGDAHARDRARPPRRPRQRDRARVRADAHVRRRRRGRAAERMVLGGLPPLREAAAASLRAAGRGRRARGLAGERAQHVRDRARAHRGRRTDGDVLMAGRRERALEAARSVGADVLLAAHPSTVTWLSGYAPELETGPSPFALSPLAVLAPGRLPVLVVSEDEAEAAAATGCEVAAYPGFGLGPIDPLGAAASALAPLVEGARVATEAAALPAGLAWGLEWIDVGAELARARAVKDTDEVERLRAAIAVCDAGQAAAREHAVAGISELELWASVRGAMEEKAGSRLPVLADLVSGERTAEIGGPPGSRRLAEGDLVL